MYYGVKTAIENDTTVKEIQFKENTGFNSSPNSIFNSARQESTYQSKFEFFKKKDEPPVQQVIKTKPSEDFWRVDLFIVKKAFCFFGVIFFVENERQFLFNELCFFGCTESAIWNRRRSGK